MSKLYENNCDISNPAWFGWQNLHYGTIMAQDDAYGIHGQGIRVLANDGNMAWVESPEFQPQYGIAVGFWIKPVSIPTVTGKSVRVLRSDAGDWFVDLIVNNGKPEIRIAIGFIHPVSQWIELELNVWTWVRVLVDKDTIGGTARLLVNTSDVTVTNSTDEMSEDYYIDVGPEFTTGDGWEYHIDHFIVGTDLADVAEPVYALPRRRMMMGIGK